MMASSMQIDHETSVESFDERRVNQLKAQLAQLERQAVLLTKSLSGYKEKLHFAEGAIQQSLQTLTTSLNSGPNRGSITLSRSDISIQVKSLEDALQRVSAPVTQNSDTPLVAQAITPNTSFLKAGHDTTIANISAGSLKHLNLAHVSKLEGRLATLYGQLSAYLIQQSANSSDAEIAHAKMLKLLQQSCEDLLQLSFLVPNVPWSNRQCLAEISVDDVMKALPKLTPSRQQDVRDLLTVVLNLSEHRYRLMVNKCKLLELDLNNLRKNERKTTDHVKTTSATVLSELSNYHDNIKETIVTPLAKILENFQKLSESPTDDNLKHFLHQFKENAPQLETTCSSIKAHQISEDLLISSFSPYTKPKKRPKSLKSEEMKLGDEEELLRQSEQEARDEVLHRVAQLSVSPANVSRTKVKRTDVAACKSNRAKPAAQPSVGAKQFLTKLDKVETHLETSQTAQAPLSTSRSISYEQPDWLQEMRGEHPVATSNIAKELSVKKSFRR